MRTVYLFLLALLSVLCWSCYDDQGNYDYHELNRTAVSGIDPVYRCDLLSRLSIPVVIQSEDKDRTYDYVWMYHKSEGSKKVEFYETEKVREKMEDMRLYIQIVMESRSFCIVGN